jgi:predicted lipoprotein with Yx(FWY)xxD motif
MGKRWLVPVSLAAAALIATGCGSSSSSNSPGSAGSGSHSSAALKTRKIGGATVLTNSKGFTLYWFVPDTSTTSKCNGECAQFWPPVPGPVTAGPGVTGTLGTITRADGSTQATWNGHPLYTFKDDTAPGQANGNGKNLSGGVWHEITLSGTSATSSSSSSSSGGGGYGY